MYAPAEAIITPENRAETRRVFVAEDLEESRLRSLLQGVMGVYSEVSGRTFSELEQRDYPQIIIDRLQGTRSFELRFGIPKLSGPPMHHGKLWGKKIEVGITETSVQSLGFWVDTNDYDALTPQPDASRRLVEDFDLALLQLADAELVDLSIPAPRSAFVYSRYNPAE